VINKENTNQFTQLVENLILTSENNLKLAETIRWIDQQSRKNVISFYEMAYVIVDKQLIKKRAQQWSMSKREECRNNNKKIGCKRNYYLLATLWFLAL
jgi:hypothetical protein